MGRFQQRALPFFDRFDGYKIVERHDAEQHPGYVPVSAFLATGVLNSCLCDPSNASRRALFHFACQLLGHPRATAEFSSELQPHVRRALERAFDEHIGAYVLLKQARGPLSTGLTSHEEKEEEEEEEEEEENNSAPPSEVVADTTKSLTLTLVDSQFAPSVEKLDIQYKLANLSGDNVRLVIVSTAEPGTTLYQRALTVDEKADGDHTVQWDGRAGGAYITPQKSPFTVTLQVVGDDTLKGKAETKVELASIDLVLTDVSNDKLFMNNPAEKFEVKATLKIKKKDGSGVVTAIEQKVRYTFTDPAPTNTTKADSFEYNTASHLSLGKTNDAAAVHWANHAGSTSTSADGYKTQCDATTIVAAGADQGVAKIDFKPSGVGKDSFKLKAAVLAADGTTELLSRESAKLTVWRKLVYNDVYTMDGENYIDAATVIAAILPAFQPANVDYERGVVNTLAANLSVKYIGLYDAAAAGRQKNWPADFSPANLETAANQLKPTPQELTNYAYVGADPAKGAAKAVAKSAIEAKAQLWFNAIVASYKSCCSAWFAAAGVGGGGNSLLAVQYYHPKLSNAGDGATNFWPAGISINLANPGSGRNSPGDPDQATWREVQGFNRGRTSVIFKNYGTAARLQIVCRHEIGHATRSEFRRDNFGVGDHSASGLMTPFGSAALFSADDQKILRGVTP